VRDLHILKWKVRKGNILKNDSTPQLSLIFSGVIGHNQLAVFYPLLQQGFRVDVVVGQSIQKILCHQLNINADYLEERIKTIFLNGKPVDDVHSAIIKDGATLSLSAAMPGLVGATFRKGGHLASLRGSITHQKEDETANQHEGHITLKLFNLLVKELGPIFLERGIWIQKKDLGDIVHHQPEIFWTKCKRIRINGQAATPQELVLWPRSYKIRPDQPQLVSLKVRQSLQNSASQ
jgi:hypothetical protein